MQNNHSDFFHQILKQYWGYSTFRPLQENIIDSIYQGKDTLGLMPTGGGKSITFQVPALAMSGTCIVITPLISLMKDQVDNLKERGIKAIAIYSGMQPRDIQIALDNVIYGEYKFLYVSPERLSTQLFLNKLPHIQVNFIVVDEAHCISQWGYDFRPSYLNISSIRQQLPSTPILALTATATPEVVQDIQQRLLFTQENVFQKSFDRSNLHYVVRHSEHKERDLINILKKTSGTVIVYVRSREKTREISKIINEEGITSDFYHAGLSPFEKESKQNAWKQNLCRVIVATNAFGMGIDKPDVRLVVHIDLPNSIEEYYQEAGRAGRDEQKAYAVLLTTKRDEAKLKKRIQDEFPEREFIRDVYEHLAYFFQVAIDTGQHMSFSFDIQKFCAVYKYPIASTHNALKILELSQYITYREETDKHSLLKFILYRSELYDLNLSEDLDDLVCSILRTYAGIFTDYVRIDESKLASILQKTPHQVYKMLVSLSAKGIVQYIPHKQGAIITYQTSRIPMHYISIPRDVYDERRDRNMHRINAMRDYITRTDICRSRMLLVYLGEKKVYDCGRCDVCIGRRKRGLSNQSFEKIREKIQELLSEQESFSLSQVPIYFEQEDQQEVVATIRFLADQDILQIKMGRIYAKT